MSQRKLVLRALGIALLFGLIFWLLDSLAHLVYFGSDLRHMMFKPPETLLDALLFKVSLHTLFVRFSFIVACLIGGLISAYFIARHHTLERRHQTYIANAPLGVFVADAQGHFIQVNPAASNLTGYRQAELLAMFVADLYDPDEAVEVADHLQEIKQTGRLSLETVARRKDGAEFDLRLDVVALPGGDLMAFGQDITMHKRADEVLRQSEERFRTTLHSIGDAVISTDPQGWIQFMNAVAEALTGWTVQQARGKPVEQVFQIVSEETGQAVESPVARVLREGVVVGLANHTLLIDRDGATHPIADSGAPIRVHNEITGVVLVFRDQTEERAAHRALRESEARYRRTLDTMLEGCQIIGFDWRYLYLNDAAVQHSRQTRQDLIGRTMMDVYPGIETTGLFSALQRCMDERAAQAFENGFPYPDGSTGWFELSIQPSSEGLFILSVDISERKKAEETIQSLARFPAENPNPVLRIRRDGIVLYANEASEALLRGWRLDVGQPAPEILQAVVSDTLTQQAEITLDIGHEQRIISFFVAPVLGAGYANLYGRDVTEVRRAEEALRESEERFRQIYEHMAVGIAQVSLDYRIEIANEAYCRMLGYVEEELVGKYLRDITHPEIVAENLRRQAQLAAGEIDHFRMEKQFVHKNGHVVHGILDANLVRDAQGKPRYCLGSVLDITERKRAEESLRQSEARFAAIFHQSPAAVALTRASDSQLVDVNAAWEATTGYTRAEALGQTPLALNLWVDPEERRRLAEVSRERTARGEAQVRRKSGEIRVMLMSAELIELGGEQYLLTMALDITERRRAENALRESEEETRRLLSQQVVINHMSLALGESLDLNQVYHIFYESIQTLVDAWAFFVSSYDEQTRLIYAQYAMHQGQVVDVSQVPPVSLAAPGQGTQSQAIHTGRPVYIANYQQAVQTSQMRCTVEENGSVYPEAPSENDQEETTRSALYVPMKVQGAITGMLQVQSCRPAAYTEEDIQLLAGAANVAAIAIQNARLHEAVLSELAERQRAEERILEQLDELRRWHAATVGREMRVLDLKHEVNGLLAQLGQPPRYASAEQE